MRHFLNSVFARRDRSEIQKINALRAEFSRLSDSELRARACDANDLLPLIAVTAAVASRVLGQDMFDVQLRGALALARGSIAEMQTGEGKTLAAVPAVAWYARASARRSCDDRQRLPGSARRRLDGRDLSLPGSLGRLSAAGHERGRTPRRLRLRRHVRDGQRNRLRFSARPAGAALGRAGAAPVRCRRNRRSGFHPDRRSAHPAGDRGRRHRTTVRLAYAADQVGPQLSRPRPLHCGRGRAQCRADRRWESRWWNAPSAAAICTRSAISRFSPPCRIRCMPTLCCTATSITW